MIENMNGISSVATLPLPIQREVIGNAGRVRAYIQAYELEAAVNKTVSLAQSELPSGSETLLLLSNDCESEETWLVVHLAVNAPRDQIFAIFNRFADVWIDSVPTAAQHRIHFTYATKPEKEAQMGNKQCDEVELLAMWLYGEAKEAGQLDLVRRLINSSQKSSISWYGLPEGDEPDDPQDLSTIIGKFAATWDEVERNQKRDDAEDELRNPSPAS